MAGNKQTKLATRSNTAPPVEVDSPVLSWLLPEWLIFRHALHVRNSCVTYRGLSAHGLCLDRVLSYLITDTVARLDNDVAHHAPFFRAITRP